MVVAVHRIREHHAVRHRGNRLGARVACVGQHAVRKPEDIRQGRAVVHERAIDVSPAATRRQWQERITKHYETHRVTKDGYRKYSVVRKIISAKKKKLGREAAGWNAAAQALNATRIPAWVSRHGTSEGSCSFIKTGQHLVLTLRNSVPYNERMTRERAEFALRKVTQGFDNNLRVLKKKLLRQIRK